MSMEASFFSQPDKPIQPEASAVEAVSSENDVAEVTEIAPEAITEPAPEPVPEPDPPVAEAAQANAVNTKKNEFLGDIENGVESGYKETVSDLTAANYPKKFMEIVDEANHLIKKGIQSLRHNCGEIQVLILSL